MRTLTRVEVLDTAGQVAGYFFTPVTVDTCLNCKIPLDFQHVTGEWEPAGGVHLDAAGANAWFRASVVLGEMRKVDDRD